MPWQFRRRSRCCAWGSRGFFRRCGVIYVRVLGWLSLSKDWIYVIFTLIGPFSTVPVFTSSASQSAFASPLFFAECSSSCSLSCLQLSLTFHVVFYIRQFRYANAIFSFVQSQMVLSDCCEGVLESWLFLSTVWTGHCCELQVDFEFVPCYNLALQRCLLEGFCLCNSCWGRLDFGSESF